MKGKLKSKNPPVEQGQFTFFDPVGNPFASGFYSEDILYRAWSFFDDAGKVIESINYSSAIKFLNERSNIDIGNNFLYVADTLPHNEQGDIFESLESFVKSERQDFRLN